MLKEKIDDVLDLLSESEIMEEIEERGLFKEYTESYLDNHKLPPKIALREHLCVLLGLPVLASVEQIIEEIIRILIREKH
jgi:hypothetical protein